MSAEVLLIQPPWENYTEETICIPLGLAWIGSVLLSEGIKVIVVDFIIEKCVNWQKKLMDVVNNKKIKVIGIQFHSIASFSTSCNTAKYIKNNWPNILLVAGGETASKKAHFLLENEIVDIVVDSEGEIPFKEIVLNYIKYRNKSILCEISGIFFTNKKGSVQFTGKRPLISNLDTLPLPARDLFLWRKYPQWSVFTSRGCPYGCTFCSASEWWRHKIRYRSIDNVINELKILYNKYNVRNIYIGDDIFTYDKKRVKELCKKLITNNLKFTWSCLTRADCLDYPLLKIMKGSGCKEISIGLESANNKTLRLINKHETSQIIRDSILMCKRIGIHVRVTVILGLPGENIEDVKRTTQFLLEVQPNEIQLYSLAPYDGAILFGSLDNIGIKIIEKDPSNWTRNVLSPICETEFLNREQIRNLALELVNELIKKGYKYFHSNEKNIKRGLNKVVYTGFCPIQTIPDARK